MTLKSSPHEVVRQLESLGESEVRKRLPLGEFGDVGSELRLVVDTWQLASQESSRKVALDARSEARADESLSISREAISVARRALVNSRLANIIAISAIIFSGITAIVAASTKFIPLLRWLRDLWP